MELRNELQSSNILNTRKEFLSELPLRGGNLGGDKQF